MCKSTKPSCRQGVTTLEFALVAVVVFILIYGTLVGGAGVFRYQEMAHLAREGARWAAVHGGDYHYEGQDKKTGVPQIASQTDIDNYLRPKAVGLDKTKLTISISWSSPANYVPRNAPVYMDSDPTIVPPGQKVYQNFVTVTVTYDWYPEVYLLGPYKLKGVSTMPVSY